MKKLLLTDEGEMRKEPAKPNQHEKQGADSCRFNEGVACMKQECGGCGWNPEVVAERNAAIAVKIKEGTL